MDFVSIMINTEKVKPIDSANNSVFMAIKNPTLNE